MTSILDAFFAISATTDRNRMDGGRRLLDLPRYVGDVLLCLVKD